MTEGILGEKMHSLFTVSITSLVLSILCLLLMTFYLYNIDYNTNKSACNSEEIKNYIKFSITGKNVLNWYILDKEIEKIKNDEKHLINSIRKKDQEIYEGFIQQE
jgi:sensor histidine kinase YesM